MITLTCRNHTNLRWLAKAIAVNDDGSYNGRRNIFFVGVPCDGPLRHSVVIHGENGDVSIAQECPCSPRDLTFADDTQRALWQSEQG